MLMTVLMLLSLAACRDMGETGWAVSGCLELYGNRGRGQPVALIREVLFDT